MRDAPEQKRPFIKLRPDACIVCGAPAPRLCDKHRKDMMKGKEGGLPQEIGEKPCW